MSGVSVIAELLHASSELLAGVPADRIFSGVVPLETQLPAISVTEISLVELPTIDAQAPTMLVNERVQVTVLADDYPTLKAVLELARQACNYQRGSLAGVSVVSVRREAHGPDVLMPETNFYSQSVDFIVTYHQPT